jgi:hypothetical protein
MSRLQRDSRVAELKQRIHKQTLEFAGEAFTA